MPANMQVSTPISSTLQLAQQAGTAVGCGRTYPCAAEAGESYREAARALQSARFLGEKSLVRFEDLGERITAQARPGTNPKINVVDSAADAFGDDLVILATVAGEPHIFDPAVLAHAPVVLHLSLRDLAPELILAATNITDDIDHAVRERTSLHLTEQRVGDRSFVHGTIADVLRGDLVRDPSRAAIFAPFGLGVLDIAVGGWVYERVCEAGGGTVVNGFFDGVAR